MFINTVSAEVTELGCRRTTEILKCSFSSDTGTQRITREGEAGYGLLVAAADLNSMLHGLLCSLVYCWLSQFPHCHKSRAWDQGDTVKSSLSRCSSSASSYAQVGRQTFSSFRPVFVSRVFFCSSLRHSFLLSCDWALGLGVARF